MHILKPTLFYVAVSLWISCGFFYTHAAEQSRPIAKLNSYSGNVVVSSSAGQKQPKIGMSLSHGYRLQIAKQSRATVYLNTGGFVECLSGASVAFHMAGKAPGLKVLKGPVRIVTDRPKSNLILGTKSYRAVLGESRLIVSKERLIVLQGEVRVNAPGGWQRVLYGGEMLTPIRGANKVANLPFEQLPKLDARFDRTMSADQVPYIMAHQDWTALVAKTLDYHLPDGWSAYAPQVYLDLFSDQQKLDIYPDSFFQVVGKDHLQLVEDSRGGLVATASSEPITLTYRVAVPRSGEYTVRTKVAGNSQYWTFSGYPTLLSPTSYSLQPTKIGPIRLERGVYTLSVSVPRGGKLGAFKLEGQAFAGIEPTGGWRKDGVFRNRDLVQFLNKLDKSKAAATAYNDVVGAERLSFLTLFKWLLPNAIAAGQPPSDFQTIVSELKKRGFVLGPPNDPVLGPEALINASLLAPREVEEKPASLRQIAKKKEVTPETYRSPITPVFPSGFID